MKKKNTKIEIIPATRDPKVLAQFMAQPQEKIAAAITGGLAAGREDLILIGGRLVQGALKGKFMQQFGREVKQLIEKGKIPNDYARKKFGFQSLAELLEFIDNETINEDRFLAIKAMFFSVNYSEIGAGELIVNYQLFQLSKRLSSSQLLLLKICYDLYNNEIVGEAMGGNHDHWLELISKRIGHKVVTLIMQDENQLVEFGLLSGRIYSDFSGINPKDARLTDLGKKFCENIENYEKQIESIS